MKLEKGRADLLGSVIRVSVFDKAGHKFNLSIPLKGSLDNPQGIDRLLVMAMSKNLNGTPPSAR